ncbi:MAG: glycine zipper family protein [Acetobacteraceae bacterium]|nr:hypothetical protein [Pseudomonadota bacterium]
MQRLAALTALASVLALGACTPAPPAGPSVMALPPQGKPFDQFQREDYNCRVYADQVMGGVSAQQAAANAGVGSAALGTALGAGLGAAIGAAGGAAGPGAAVGAAAGLLTGSAIGANNAQAAGVGAQARYDTAYTQCMYANGNSVQSAPGAYAAAAPYGYPSGYGYAPAVVAGPTVVVGGGWGGGWGWGGGPYGWHRGWGWRGPGWYR